MDILSAIGNTPLIQLKNMVPGGKVRVLCKFEGANPGGSIKDRPALYMIRQAEAEGRLSPEKVIIEPTSGNTGIALAMIGAAKGYRVTLCVPACVSIERRRILEALGADIVLTPPDRGTDGAILKAREIVEAEPDRYFMPDQFSNPCNSLAHYETTGPEIWRQTEGSVICFVAGMGTTGTLMGTGRYLKEQNPSIHVVGVEPVPGHSIQGLKNMKEAIVPKIYDPSALTSIVPVTDEEAFSTARRLAEHEGIFAGMSGGAAVAVALQQAALIDEGTIVTVLPDRGDRYLSTALFASVCSKCPP
jgi:cysteine synthase B